MKLILIGRKIWNSKFSALIFILPLPVVGCYIGFDIIQACNSPARQLALDVLERIPVVQQALGNSRLSVCYFGRENYYRIYIFGKRDRATYYVYTWKQKDGRFVVGGRVDFNNSGSFEIHSDQTNSSYYALAVNENAEPLPGDRSAASSWRSVQWSAKGLTLHFDVPASAEQMKLLPDEAQFKWSDDKGSFHFIAHISPVANADEIFWLPVGRRLGYPASGLEYQRGVMKELINHDKRAYATGRSRGWVSKEVAQIPGMMRWPNYGTKFVHWTGYIQSQEHGLLRVSFLLGASTKEDFHKAKPILGAVLASIKRI